MDHDRALIGIAGGGQHRRMVAARDGPRLHQHPIRADSSEKAHFPATGLPHLRPNLLGGRRCETEVGRGCVTEVGCE